MIIAIASDHAGYGLKEKVKKHLESLQHDVHDCGTDSADSVDYPDFAIKAAKTVSDKNADFAIVICGSGIGVSISANKVKGIRCALCVNEEMAALARQHNNANVLALGARLLDSSLALKIISTFLSTEFAGGRHQNRVNRIHQISGC